MGLRHVSGPPVLRSNCLICAVNTAFYGASTEEVACVSFARGLIVRQGDGKEGPVILDLCDQHAVMVDHALKAAETKRPPAPVQGPPS